MKQKILSIIFISVLITLRFVVAPVQAISLVKLISNVDMTQNKNDLPENLEDFKQNSIILDIQLTQVKRIFPDWTFETTQENSDLGFSVASAGDVNGDGYFDIIIGAYHFDNGENDEGAVFLFLGSENGLSSEPDWMFESNQENAYLGTSVGTAGDVNGDGYSDVIIGCEYYDNDGDGKGEGRVFGFYGSLLGLSEVPDWVVVSNKDYSQFGFSVGTAGDVNADGFSDVIIGAPGEESSAYVYLGSADGLQTYYAWYVTISDQLHSQFGRSIGSAGDINGDGYSDVIVGAFHYTNTHNMEGAAFVYLGSVDGLENDYNWSYYGGEDSACFGYSVSSAGDVNGDGYDDVVVGAPYYGINKGRVQVFHGSSVGLSTSVNWEAQGNTTNSYFGRSVNIAGDINQDGNSDIIIGAGNGPSYLYSGSDQGLLLQPSWIAEDEQSGSSFGEAVASAADVNGDGFTDIIVGAPGFDGESEGTGKAYLYYGVSTEAPIANAGTDQNVETLTLVSLDGSGSFDENENLPLSYWWEQVGGNSVELDDPTNSQPTFFAPNDPSKLTFYLVVTNNLDLTSEADDVVITVNNQAPIANAGIDQDVYTLFTVNLDGTGSSDPDEDIPLTYFWRQTSGDSVILVGENSQRPTFIAPNDPGLITFELIVTDNLGLVSEVDEVVVTVQDSNRNFVPLFVY